MDNYKHLPKDILSEILKSISRHQKSMEAWISFSEKPYLLHGKFNPFIFEFDEDKKELQLLLDFALNRKCLNDSKFSMRDTVTSLVFNLVPFNTCNFEDNNFILRSKQ